MQPGMGPRGILLQSDKCDFRIQASQLDVRGALTPRGGLDVRLSGPGFGGALQSDKCDWVIRARGQAVSRPELEARLTSEKREFQLRIEVGLPGGPRLRFRGVGSDKCDFRLDRVEQTADGRTWRDIPLKGKSR